MIRTGLIFGLLALGACSSQPAATDTDDSAFHYDNFATHFQPATLPYQLTDTALLNNGDTAALQNAVFQTMVPDSLVTRVLGKHNKVAYVPLVRFGAAKKEQYFVVKATNGARKGALLLVFTPEGTYSAGFPFLLPDADSKTTQASSVDRSYSVSRITARKEGDVVTEGRDVYAYNAAANAFTLIMTDQLDGGSQEVINPIDTAARTHHYAGDYVKDKRNLVAIRDGRTASEIQFFIHFERMEGECNGELKGTALFTSSKTAVFRTGGDPCVLELHFGTNSVTLKEVEGCGSHRGIRCVIEGSFPKKKVVRENSSSPKKTV